MSSFSVSIKKIISVEPHPNADRIEIVQVDGYRSVAQKGQFSPGDLTVYIPEAALLPRWLLERLGFWNLELGVGRLNGPLGNRVKAIKLRGVLSQGICAPVNQGEGGCGRFELPDGSLEVALGQDVTAQLGITKYEPPIPVEMSGAVFNAGTHLTLKFDVENIKSYPHILQPGESVVITEKLHGSFTGVAIVPAGAAHHYAFGRKNNVLIFSKGLGGKGLVLMNTPENQHNLYVRATSPLVDRIDQIDFSDLAEPIFLCGETYGQGVQDLNYGTPLGFALFAVARVHQGELHYLPWDVVSAYARLLGVDTVPVLYKGAYNPELVARFTAGPTLFGAGHIREGIVITSAIERMDPEFGRVSLKSISEQYLLRENGTEYT